METNKLAERRIDMSNKETDLDLMSISMSKLKEDNDYVWYKIEISKDIGWQINKQGKRRFESQLLFGVFRFKKDLFKGNREDFDLNNYINFEEKETDLLLLTRKKDILIRCYVVMNKHLKDGFFPDKTCLATG